MTETSGPLTVIPQSMETSPYCIQLGLLGPKVQLRMVQEVRGTRDGGFSEERVLEPYKCST